jgi:tRNA A37 threonylcarbamoyladenosine dehydratase
MEDRYTRTEMLLGREGVDRLKGSAVIVFGVGGVGGYTVEALARAGVGHIAVVDSDAVSESNINRQIIATRATVGRKKVDVIEERIHEISPDISVEKFDIFFESDTKCKIDFTKYDYIVDAIDSVSSKVLLVECANEAGVPIISSMGTGNKLDPTAFRVTDISKTKVCPLARAVRTRLRKIGINHLKVVYSEEEPHVTAADGERLPPASVSFVPGVAGLILAGQIIVDLTAEGKGSLDEG